MISYPYIVGLFVKLIFVLLFIIFVCICTIYELIKENDEFKETLEKFDLYP